jgi:hypothetical protein
VSAGCDTISNVRFNLRNLRPGLRVGTRGRRAYLSVALFSAVVALLIVAGPAQSQIQFPAPFPSDATKVEPDIEREFLELVCPGKVTVSASASCPCLDGSNETLAINRVLFGHFLDASSDDALVGTVGCEPHVAGYGGNVLFTRTSGKWTISRPYSPGPVGWCRRVASVDGRDGLLCFREDHWAEGTNSGWLTFGYETKEGSDSVELVRITDNVEEACRDAHINRKTTAIASRIEKAVLSKTASGQVTMTVRASCQRGFLPLRVQSACRSNGYVDGIKLGGPLKRHDISYVLDGERFVPTASGKAAAQALQQCTEPAQ